MKWKCQPVPDFRNISSVSCKRCGLDYDAVSIVRLHLAGDAAPECHTAGEIATHALHAWSHATLAVLGDTLPLALGAQLCERRRWGDEHRAGDPPGADQARAALRAWARHGAIEPVEAAVRAFRANGWPMGLQTEGVAETILPPLPER